MVATECTQQLNKLLCLSKGATPAPTKNFWELKVNIATFMLRIWLMFGSECDYNKGLRQVYNTFEMKEVGLLKVSFTPKHCRQVTWAINNGRSYFDNLKTTLDFQGPNQIVFPQSSRGIYATLPRWSNQISQTGRSVKHSQPRRQLVVRPLGGTSLSNAPCVTLSHQRVTLGE
jgi:hypothetical protein